jgi:hypothetical protein
MSQGHMYDRFRTMLVPKKIEAVSVEIVNPYALTND